MKHTLAVYFCFAVFATYLLADEIVIEGDLKVEESLVVIGDNGVVFKGAGPIAWNTPGPGSIPDDSTDPRFMWYPAKAALRFGSPGGRTWSDSDIGIYSAAWGYQVVSSGIFSTAWGMWTYASNYSTAWGEGTAAVYAGTVWGYWSVASGYFSTAWGEETVAAGEASTSWGIYTRADSLYSTALGRNNIGGGHPTQWIETDPLFEIGNGGEWGGNPSNAFTVLKNGNVGIGDHQPDELLVVAGTSRFEDDATFESVVRIQPAGDISMGAFTAEP